MPGRRRWPTGAATATDNGTAPATRPARGPGGPGGPRGAVGMGRTFQANQIDVDQSVLNTLLVGAHRNIAGGVAAATLRTGRNRDTERRAREVARAVARLLDLDLVLDVPARALDFG